MVGLNAAAYSACYDYLTVRAFRSWSRSCGGNVRGEQEKVEGQKWWKSGRRGMVTSRGAVGEVNWCKDRNVHCGYSFRNKKEMNVNGFVIF